MKNRVASGLIAVSLVAVFGFFIIPTAPARKVDRLRIITSSLPVGSTRSQVASMLNKEGVPSVYERIDKNFMGASDVSDFGFSAADLSGYTVAYIRGTPRSIIGGCSVYFNFYFDKKGKLIKVANQTRCIGL